MDRIRARYDHARNEIVSTARKINKSLQMTNAKDRDQRRERRQIWFMIFTNAKNRGRRNYIGSPFRLGRRAVAHLGRSLYSPHQGKREIARRLREMVRVPISQLAEACGPEFMFLRNVEIRAQ